MEISTKKTKSGRNEYFNVYTVKAFQKETHECETYNLYATKKAAEDAIQFINYYMSDYYDYAYVIETIVWC